METVKASGGGDYEEAIEIGLQYVNKEKSKHEIKQVLLFGDAPAKSFSQIENYRKSYGGEDFWNKKGFIKTHYKNELELLKNSRIPVHAFYLETGN